MDYLLPVSIFIFQTYFIVINQMFCKVKTNFKFKKKISLLFVLGMKKKTLDAGSKLVN